MSLTTAWSTQLQVLWGKWRKKCMVDKNSSFSISTLGASFKFKLILQFLSNDPKTHISSDSQSSEEVELRQCCDSCWTKLQLRWRWVRTWSWRWTHLTWVPVFCLQNSRGRHILYSRVLSTQSTTQTGALRGLCGYEARHPGAQGLCLRFSFQIADRLAVVPA